MIQQKEIHTYSGILEDHNIEYSSRYPWLICGQTNRVQGWKIHLSSIQIEADQLLHCVLPYLIQNQLAFKIAEDYRVVSQLNEGALGDTQVGKFMTIYPETDQLSGRVAEDLVDLTRDFHGPVIPSDLHLGSIVYSRYGAYNPIIEKNRFGFLSSKIYNLNGNLEKDRYQLPFDPQTLIKHPYSNLRNFDIDEEYGAKTGEERLFGPGYLVLEVVKSHSKGGIFRVMDLRSQESVGIKIVKQARKYCFSDEYGRDGRTRLKHQFDLHQLLQDKMLIPSVYDRFQVEGDSYLVMENIEGNSFDSKVADLLKNIPWKDLSKESKINILGYFRKIIEQLVIMHEQGVIHRDITPRNIFVTPDDEVYLIDLELSYVAGSTEPIFDMGTIGYMSANQENRLQPVFTDDIYSLGCVFIFGITGIDPRKILFQGRDKLDKQLIPIVGQAAVPLIEVIQQMLSGEISLKNVLRKLYVLEPVLTSTSAIPSIGMVSSRPPVEYLLEEDLNSVIASAIRGLFLPDYFEKELGMWHSDIGQLGNGQHNQFSGSFGVRYDANSGIAGPVYLLARLARSGFSIPSEFNSVMENAIALLTSKKVNREHNLPGLHFGSAGRAVAMAECIQSGICKSTNSLHAFILNALSGPIDWPDLTHGAAGQGLAALIIHQKFGGRKFLNIADRCADYLIDTQNQDGSWTMPEGVEGISGETLTGFAHGVSGIIYYLAVYQNQTGIEIQPILDQAIQWLINHSVAKNEGETFTWNYSDKNKEIWKWWCHGSPGIALTFLKLYELSGKEKFADLARKCLNVYPDVFVYPNLSQCHGLSGIGEIYLEAYRVLKDEKYLEKANNIAQVILCFRNDTTNQELIWLTENANKPTADLMTGSSGIIHFLLRLREKGELFGFPLLPDAC